MDRIRPELGLARKRDRSGHEDLCRSIKEFGVLTPITVRPSPDVTGEFLLIKGQGRTLACRMLGLPTIPALVVLDSYPEADKVGQFLVENIARLKQSPVDRALLIAHARKNGEETSEIAKRFAVSPATVRRLESQFRGASRGEVAALRSGQMTLSLHAVVVRNGCHEDREAMAEIASRYRLNAREFQTLLDAIGWRQLSDFGPSLASERLGILRWFCKEIASIQTGSIIERITEAARRMPIGIIESQEVSAAL